MITVLADQYHYQLREHLHPSIKLETYDAVEGWSKEQLERADALLVRTTTPVRNGGLPEKSKIKFVATASAGRDHLDDEWLVGRGIHVADAKGSNARSVGEYVAVALWTFLYENHLQDLRLTAGIIGAGWTGSAVAHILEKTGIRCLLHDPPRQEREPGSFRSASLSDVLSCDILSFHVPLIRSGPHPTAYWFDRKRIGDYQGQLVINASRGGVVKEAALIRALNERKIRGYICDVWENEPRFIDESVKQAWLATPHIAGYSVQAKREATRMMCKKLHDFFGLDNPTAPEPLPDPVNIPSRAVTFSDTIRYLHPAFGYDRSLRRLCGLSPEKKGVAFLKLRQDTPLRTEFRHLEIPQAITERFSVLKDFGLRSASRRPVSS